MAVQSLRHLLHQTMFFTLPAVHQVVPLPTVKMPLQLAQLLPSLSLRIIDFMCGIGCRSDAGN
jgi:hypothetical protein